MKIVKIKMLKNFRDDHCSIVLHEGETYFAIDGGDYWLVQRFLGADFTKVVPKVVEISPEPARLKTTITAEVVPTYTYTDQSPQQCPGCSVGLHKPDGE